MAKTLPTMPIKTAKRNRLICFIAFMLVDLLAPVLITGFRFKLFTQFNGYKLTAIGIFILVILLFKFRSKIMEHVEKWEYSVLKYIVLGFNKVLVFVILSVLVHLCRIMLEDMIFCIDWILICSLIAYLVIQPFEEYYDAIIKRETRKEEVREVLNENR